MMRRTTPFPAAESLRSLRDVRDVEGYVNRSLVAIGVSPASPVHAPLVAHGVRSIYRLERALPPEASLRAVLDEVLGERLAAALRRTGTPALAGPAAA